MIVSSAPEAEPSAATGAWSTGVMTIVEAAVPVRGPPAPELPLSFTDRVRAVLALGTTFVSRKLKVLEPPAPNRAPSCERVPPMVIAPVPEPEMLVPLSPAEAFSTPSPTDRVTVTDPEPASRSATERPAPFRFSGDCSVAV